MARSLSLASSTFLFSLACSHSEPTTTPAPGIDLGSPPHTQSKPVVASSSDVTDVSTAQTSNPEHHHRFEVHGATFDVRVTKKPAPSSLSSMYRWAERSAECFTRYFGDAHTPHMRIELVTRYLPGVGFGEAIGKNVRIKVGRSVTTPELKNDWVMLHEMFHTSFPNLDSRHNWMEEGLSTYLEPIARARYQGHPARRVWKHFMSRMPHGQPQRGDHGLDITRTWGRLYWGGALFWMVADIEIRKATDNRRSLDDAIRAIAKAGGVGKTYWPIAKVITHADLATGTTVVSTLYNEMGHSPVDVDLETLWLELGIIETDEGIEFDDTAPLAEIRKSITGAT